MIANSPGKNLWSPAAVAPSPPAPPPPGGGGGKSRAAFTLVEMLVATALIMFIMLILSEAFVAGLNAFRTLKGIGDAEERIRIAVTPLREDLRGDHFDGRRRLSDPMFWNQGSPREGFVNVTQ